MPEKLLLWWRDGHNFTYANALYFCIGCGWRELTLEKWRFLHISLHLKFCLDIFVSTVEDLQRKIHINICKYSCILKYCICLILRQDLKKKLWWFCFIFNQYYSSVKEASLYDWVFLDTHNMMRKKWGNIFRPLYETTNSIS